MLERLLEYLTDRDSTRKVKKDGKKNNLIENQTTLFCPNRTFPYFLDTSSVDHETFILFRKVY